MGRFRFHFASWTFGLITLSLAAAAGIRGWNVPVDTAQQSVIHKDFKLEAHFTLPDNILSLAPDITAAKVSRLIFAGTAHSAEIYRIRIDPPCSTTVIASGLCDDPQFGIAGVNAMALRDVNGDRKPELVAVTNQELPIGRPRTYVWSLGGPQRLLAASSVNIESSWSHSIAFGVDPSTGRETIISAYCGHGEVMEHRLPAPSATQTKVGGDFQSTSLETRMIAQLPASGEQAAVGWLGLGVPRRLVVAVGFKLNGAEIRFYRRDFQNQGWKLERTLREDGRFGNVRFLITDINGDGLDDLCAWWCSELSGGQAEMISYRFTGNDGIARQVIAADDAADIWPRDNQMAEADLDGDGRSEVWFAASSGAIHRWTGFESRDSDAECPPIERIAQLPEGLGPIAAFRARTGDMLYLAVKNQLMSLQQTQKDPNKPINTKRLGTRNNRTPAAFTTKSSA